MPKSKLDKHGCHRNMKPCRNCGKREPNNLSLAYCSVTCREEYAKKVAARPRHDDSNDSGNYFDNFVDGRGW